MKTLLILFSYKYPYEPPTEQFLHTELPYLMKENTDIEIVPYARGIDFSNKYPQNADFSIKPLKRGKITDILLGLYESAKSLDVLIRELNIINKSVCKKSKFKTALFAFRQHMQAQTFCARLKKHIDTQKLIGYDKIVLYSYWLNPMSIAIATYKTHLKKCGLGNVSAIARAHGQGDLYLENIDDTYRPFARILSTQLDCIYSISAQGIQHLGKQHINNTRLHRIGIENLNTPVYDTEKKEVFHIVSCSVINSNKRVDAIAKAVANVNIPKVKWVHFGDGENYEQVSQWCTENMPQSVSWELKGWTSNEEIHKYYRECHPDVFINLSQIEGIPVSVMEAMSHAIPCIATDVGATSEIVMTKENGYLLKNNFDAHDVTSALDVIWNQSHDKKSQMKKNAYNTWKKQYDATKTFSDFSCDIYENKSERKIYSMEINFAVLGRQYEKYRDEYEEATLRALRSGWYIMGKELEKFETDYAKFIGCKHCAGVGNGLDALRLAMTALGIGVGDEVLVQTNTFIATALAVTENGATPVFVESDEYFGIDVAAIENAITPKTKAIIAVHLYGQPCDMNEIMALAKKHNLYVIEDCAQCHGAEYQGQKCGTFGDVACFSFYPMKPIGAFGDAGAIVTDNDDIYERICMLRNYGSKIKYNHEIIGINSRMDEIQAAITGINLRYAEENNAERIAIAKKYIDGIKNPKIKIPEIRPGTSHVYHVFPIFCENRDELKDHLASKGIATQIHYPICCHLAGCYAKLGYQKGDLPKSEKRAECELSLPIYVGLKDEEIEYIIDALNEY